MLIFKSLVRENWFYSSKVFLIAKPIAFAKSEGTALPICTICLHFAPLKIKSFRQDYGLAISLAISTFDLVD